MLSPSENDNDDGDDVIQEEIVEVQGEDGEFYVLTPPPVTPPPSPGYVLTPRPATPPSPGSQDMFAPSPAAPDIQGSPPPKRPCLDPVRLVQPDSSGTI